MRVPGVFAFYHDSAAAWTEDGHIVAAQEERFHRLEDAEPAATCAEDSAQCKALGWFKGRMEFGQLRGEPIAGSPDASRCLMGTGLHVPAVGNCYLREENRNPAFKQNYETAFELD